MLSGAPVSRLDGECSHFVEIFETMLEGIAGFNGPTLTGGVGMEDKATPRLPSPVLRAADLPEVAVPWWQGRRLRFQFP